MLGLRRVARLHGLDWEVRKCDMKDLTSNNLPVIGLIERNQGQKGFLLVLWVNENDAKCGVVDGFGSYKVLSIDEFRRDFSGYVLVRRRRSPPWLWPGGVALVALAALAGYGWWRVRPNWRKVAVGTKP
jgi:hypothetical protein